MDYGRLIRDAWSITWRYRFLWLLALFAGGTFGGYSGGGTQWQGDPDDFPTVGPGAEQMAGQFGRWLEANAGLIVAIAVFSALLGLVVLVISLIAQGGIAQATADLATGRPISSGQAWRAGLRLFWRYLGLWLILIVAAIAVAVAIGILGVLVALGAAIGTETPRVGVLLAALLIGLPLLLLGIVAAIALSVIVTYAQRAIAAQDVGPVEALRSGWRLLRAHLGESLLVWLISLALSVAAGLAAVLVMGVLAVPLGAIGLAIWSAVGLTAATIAYIVVAALLILLGLLLVAAIANTFFWSYWTLAYLRLGGPREGLAAT